LAIASRPPIRAFGKPQEAEEDTPEDEALAALTREQRAVVRGCLEQEEEFSV